MPTRRLNARPRDRRIVPALVAAALVLGLSGARATASTVAASIAGHGHHCKCRMHCKTACCCSSDEPPTRARSHAAPSPVAPARATPAVVGGPCLEAVPCGDAANPTSGPGVRVSPQATHPAQAAPRPATAGALVSLSPAAIPPATAPERIDEPPESRVRA